MNTAKKLLLLLSLFILFSMLVIPPTLAQTPTTDPSITPTPTSQPDNSGQIQKLNDKIKELETKIGDLKKQEDSLNSQIDVMDNQIQLTQYRINAVKEEIKVTEKDITSASKKIKKLESSLNDVTKILLTRIRAAYQAGEIDPLRIMLASSNLKDYLARQNYLNIVQEHDQELLYNTQQAKVDYNNQKALLENKSKKITALHEQLEGYTEELDNEKKTKEELLVKAKDEEKNAQSELAAARRQVASMKSFATARVGSGGSGILPPQASPDGWYYNQRDERWGNNLIGASSDQVWEVGCLLTSVTMILKEHGQDVTPASIASVNSYYAFSTAAMRIPWAGGQFQSQWGNYGSIADDIDSKLASGEPVIVGLNVTSNTVGTHFIVLKSGAGGDYTMNDPWYGPDLNFTDYYSTGNIFQYGWYNG